MVDVALLICDRQRRSALRLKPAEITIPSTKKAQHDVLGLYQFLFNREISLTPR